jgi:hypothetical protein
MILNKSLQAILGATAFLLYAQAAAAQQPQPKSVSCKLIHTAAELQAIKNNLAGSYCLAKDIDAGSIANFIPIGTSATRFSGQFFGNGYVISNLKISQATAYVGLFGIIDDATVQDVALVNVNVVGTAANANVGGLVGAATASTGLSWISRVSVTGQVSCTSGLCAVGGIAGTIATETTLTESWSSAQVTGLSGVAGGAVGVVAVVSSALTRSYATGNVKCSNGCSAGGLVGMLNHGKLNHGFASGPVRSGNNTLANAGGLVGYSNSGSVERAYATGAVSAGNSSRPGGLIGRQDNGTTDQTYAAGAVVGGSGAIAGGLIGFTSGAVSVTNSFWDTNTSGQSVSAGGMARTTVQLRNNLPPQFDSFWAISKFLSYPFLNDTSLNYNSPLATLVHNNLIYTFLPISQDDDSQYVAAPVHANGASLAAVYTMIARAIGLTENVPQLKGVKIDVYFWNDATQTTSWKGPVTLHATLGPVIGIAANTPIGQSNVIGQLKLGKPVILRGTYSSGGTTATHWMLATLFTRNPDGSAAAVVALDPRTGEQVEIDPVSKTVVFPSKFPLDGFKINGYQPVTIN